MSKKSVCIVIGGHITCCPRMMKMAAALTESGYAVSIVNPIYLDRIYETELRFLTDPRWRGAPVKLMRKFQPWTYFRTGVRMRLSRRILKNGRLERHSLVTLGRGYTRAFDELLKHALAQPADLYLGGTAGGLAVAVQAAEVRHVPFALDLEDFHSAEQDPSPETDLSHAIIAEIQRRVLPRARFLTAGSHAIAQAYDEKYGVSPETINNTFPLPPQPPLILAQRSNLRLFWFSQVIGPKRGLESTIAAMGLADISGEFHLLGTIALDYFAHLEALASSQAPRLKLIHHPAVPPDIILNLARGQDVGMAVEQAHILNRDICLCNKPFTYMLAGLAVAFTDTAGQRHLAHDLGDGALLVKIGDVAALAAGLRRWAENPAALLAAKKAAWAAAARRWHWGHPEERGKALELVRRALGEAA